MCSAPSRSRDCALEVVARWRRRQVALSRAAARPPTWALARGDRAVLEDLAAPHPPRLGALGRAGEARRTQRTVVAVRLSLLQLVRPLGEPEICALPLARQRLVSHVLSVRDP